MVFCLDFSNFARKIENIEKKYGKRIKRTYEKS